MTTNDVFGPPWTILKLLKWTTQFFTKKNLPSPRLDAELLLSHALGLERIMLYAHFDQPLEGNELDFFRSLVKRRCAHEPIAYLTGSKGFWHIELKTDQRALIPRPDTETLVELALKHIPEDHSDTVRMMDVGTGTGAVALAMAHDCDHLHVLATDVSKDALTLAAENAKALKLEARVRFVQSDLFASIPEGWDQLDLIVSNPPYIGTRERGDIEPNVLHFEPEEALFSGEDGLDLIKRLVPKALLHLKPKGFLFCEIGHNQGPEVKRIFEEAGFAHVRVARDLGDRPRVVYGAR